MSEYTAKKESSTNNVPNPLARNPVTTFQQSHLTKETIPEANIAVTADEDIVVATSNTEALSSIQSNGTITTIPIQPRQQRNAQFLQIDRGGRSEILRYESMMQRATRDFASIGTDV